MCLCVQCVKCVCEMLHLEKTYPAAMDDYLLLAHAPTGINCTSGCVGLCWTDESFPCIFGLSC